MFNGGIEDEHSVNAIIAGKVSPNFSAIVCAMLSQVPVEEP
jgi:hypothetical protein